MLDNITPKETRVEKIVVGNCTACGRELRVKTSGVRSHMWLTCKCGHKNEIGDKAIQDKKPKVTTVATLGSALGCNGRSIEIPWKEAESVYLKIAKHLNFDISVFKESVKVLCPKCKNVWNPNTFVELMISDEEQGGHIMMASETNQLNKFLKFLSIAQKPPHERVCPKCGEANLCFQW